MLSLLSKKKNKVAEQAVVVTTTTPNTNSGQSVTHNYVNIIRIVEDHSPLVLEHLDKEIANLKKRIVQLETERNLVSKVYTVLQSEYNK